MLKIGSVTLAALILCAVPYLEMLCNESGQGTSIRIIVMVSTRAKLSEDWEAPLIALIYAVIDPCSFNK